MSHFSTELVQISTKTKHLFSICQKYKESCDRLETENKELKQKLKEVLIKNDLLKASLETPNNPSLFGGSNAIQRVEVKQTIDTFIEEIDNYIALLNK